ncbi:MAG: HEPN domain-containing protein [Candidatus Kapaibacterium sp.]
MAGIFFMASAALKKWQVERSRSLDEIESTHQHIGGTGRGRRFATQQVNRAYAMLLSSEFQAFCRDLHTECLLHIAGNAKPDPMKSILETEFRLHRKLDQGNPNPGNIGSDFNRLGLDLWAELKKRYVSNTTRHDCLTQLNNWRNAIAHNDFTDPKLAGYTQLQLRDVQRWRNACNRLAAEMDIVLANHLNLITGMAPW